MKLFTDK